MKISIRRTITQEYIMIIADISGIEMGIVQKTQIGIIHLVPTILLMLMLRT